MRDRVRLKLEVENMQHHVMTALDLHESVVRSEVERAVAEFVEGDAFRTEITRVVGDSIRSHLASIVRAAIHEATYPLAQCVKDAVADAVSKRVGALGE